VSRFAKFSFTAVKSCFKNFESFRSSRTGIDKSIFREHLKYKTAWKAVLQSLHNDELNSP